MASQKDYRYVFGILADLLCCGHAVNILHLDIKEDRVELKAVLEASDEFAPVGIKKAADISLAVD